MALKIPVIFPMPLIDLSVIDEFNKVDFDSTRYRVVSNLRFILDWDEYIDELEEECL